MSCARGAKSAGKNELSFCGMHIWTGINQEKTRDFIKSALAAQKAPPQPLHKLFVETADAAKTTAKWQMRAILT
jgi:hypothetical protein